MKKITFLLMLLLTGHWLFGQEKTTAEHEEAPFKNFRIAVVMGHTAVPSGEKPAHLFVPSWGVDAEYWVSPVWGFGIHTDMELQSFVVKLAEAEHLEREYPVVATFELLVKPLKNIVLQAGPGYEFEKNENLKLLRVGLEYEFELHGGWDISPTVFYDARLDSFDTWTIGLGIGKRF